MKRTISRRNFIKTTAVGSAGLAGVFQLQGFTAFAAIPDQAPDLYSLSRSLVHEWASALLKLQITDKSRTEDYGGILSPANNKVHGRVGDTIYPFYHMAATTNDSRYIDAATLLYRWMERRVSQEDGSWLNEPLKGSWKGTTVFASIALGETLKNHSKLMDPGFKAEVENRLKKAGDFIHNNFSIDYGNINYPISASYCLALLGTLLDIPKFREKGRDLAHQSLRFITPANGLLFGEGGPYYEKSKKGCLSVDLGYNVEESLPSLVLYGLHTNDQEVLNAVTRSLQAHMEFMLPDGGWDNSWGTRNYKWTYWGSRTSDGCQPAYALLAGRDPGFYKAAVANTKLLKTCTKDGLLYGGPHYLSHQVTPSVHHTFCHIKALTTILDHGDTRKKTDLANITLPREKIYGSRFFSDIQTWLISKGKFRATVTGYDREYGKTKNGHASGGALTMLWHPETGPLLTASMNEYQLFEADNMQPDPDPYSIPLTPRIEMKTDDKIFMNICDLSALIKENNSAGSINLTTQSRLLDKDQQNPPKGEINCRTFYTFTESGVTMQFSYDNSDYNENIRIIFPVISESSEKATFISKRLLHIQKGSTLVKISSNHDMIVLPSSKGRIFNFVPGLEAIPLCIEGNDTKLFIQVI